MPSPPHDSITSKPTPRSKSPGRTKALQRKEIVAAAIETTARGHLHEMTMRSLATGLHVTPMALYAHVADKDEILDEVLDHLLTDIGMPTADDGGWRAWMTEFACQINELLCAYPELLARYLRRPVGVRAAVIRIEAALDVLSRAGFTGDECLDIYSSVHACTLGFTALGVARAAAAAASSPAARSGVAMMPDGPGFWPAFFSMLPSDQFPHLSSLQPDLQTFSSRERFVRVIGDVLAGHHPPRKRSTSRAHAAVGATAPAARS